MQTNTDKKENEKCLRAVQHKIHNTTKAPTEVRLVANLGVLCFKLIAETSIVASDYNDWPRTDTNEVSLCGQKGTNYNLELIHPLREAK